MKKILMILFLMASFLPEASAHENDFCNFTIVVKDDVQWNESYSIRSFSFMGVKKRHSRKILMQVAGITSELIKIELHEFQKKLGNVCRYKKYELDKVIVTRRGEGIDLELDFVPLVVDTKSKSG